MADAEKAIAAIEWVLKALGEDEGDVLGHTSVTMTNTYLATEDEAQATAFARFEAAGRRRALRAVAGGKA